MIQMILIKDTKGRDREDDSSVEDGIGEDLGADTASEQNETGQTRTFTPKVVHLGIVLKEDLTLPGE